MIMDLAIKIADLRTITNLIFDHIEQDLKISSVPIEEDYYWNIQTECLYDVLKDPSNIDIGQMYHDWEFLEHILKDRDQAVSLMLIHVAPLLRYIGEKIGQ